MVRPAYPAHPRLFIWGPLEARLQQPDVVILGSLNEGVWPRPQEAGPWLSRPMREALGLPAPEQITGRSAHDFAQALGAPSVYLTRALKVDGVPTVPSRWLQRLLALVEAAKLTARIAPELPFVEWARERDHAPTFAPAQPPRPCPPVAARPRGLSVTRIERWIANPYEIFARHILEARQAEAARHRARPGAARHHRPQDPARLRPRSSRHAAGRHLWRADGAGRQVFHRARRFASGRGVLAAELRPLRALVRGERAGAPGRAITTFAELDGALEIVEGFTLTARADRIDLREDGSVAIYDYKTGSVPLAKHVDELSAPQLPLEAVIAEGGGFAELGARAVSALTYIRASGRDEGGEECQAGNRPASDLARDARAKLIRLIARYDDPTMPYEVKRRRGPAFAHAYDYDDYAQLARIQEWLTQELDEDFR